MSLQNPRRSVLACSIATLLLVLAGCGQAPPPDEVRPVATVREIMADMIGPASDVLWSAVTTVSTPDGYEDQVPQTDEEWARLRQSATTMVESAGFLMTEGRPMAPEGSTAAAPGVELEPDSIETLASVNRPEWVRLSLQLQESGESFLEAIDERTSDAQRLFDAGDQLNTACEDCHQAFWYPPSRGRP